MNHILNHQKPRLVPIALCVALVLAFVTGALGRPAAVYAATITVANGEVAVSDNGLCSLREAIINANADALTHDDCVAGAGADTITLPVGGTFNLGDSFASYSGATGLPQVTSVITIEGNGSTINRSAGALRLLAVSNTGNLTLNDLTLSNGTMTTDVGGGGIYNNGGTVTINDSTFSTNSGTGSQGGGAIRTIGGTLNVNNSTFSNNHSGSSGGGGAIYAGSAATVNITDTTFSGNSAATTNGGAISTDYGGSNNITILRSTVNNNSANGGAGIFLGSGSLTITNSTISGNVGAGAGGGGILKNGGTLTLNNTTVTGNNASGGQGGGILSYGGTMNLNRSIVSGNTAAPSYNSGYEIVAWGDTKNANNYNVFGHSGITNARAFADGISFVPGANDVNATSDGGGLPTAIGSILNTTLAANGGPTDTHALVAGSPAVDRAPSVACTAAPIDSVDQRGYPRNVDGNAAGSANECDAGAFEYLSAPPPTTGDIRIVKEADPEGSTAFGFTEDIENLGFNLTDDGVTDNFIDFTAVTPGSYTVTEDGETGWTLDNLDCDDGNSTESVPTKTATIVLEAGETVTCTFSNSRDTGTIKIVKDADPADDTPFSFTEDILNTGFTLTDPADDTETFNDVPTGSYTVTEDGETGWTLDDITCSDANSSGVPATGVATINVEKDETVTCTFSNSRDTGTIKIVKDADPADDTPFSFTEDILNLGFTLMDPSDDTETFNNVPTGSYSVAETVPAPWLLDDIDCDDVNSVENEAGATAMVNLEKGETVTCTFSNSNTTTPAVEVFLSATKAGTTSDNVSFGSEDILFYDGSGWSKWFDGDVDAGLNPVKTYHNIDAFWIPDPSGDEVIVSFTRNQRPVPGINGIIDGMDLVRWDGLAFTLLFDGQDVGLENLTGENVDAVHVLPGSEWPGSPASCLHYLLISTKGVGNVPADGGGLLKFSGEDVLGFCLTQAGAQTTGLWTMVLDGSTVGMNKNSTESISLSDDGQTLYLTTLSKFTVNGVLLGNHSMVFAYDLGTQTFSGPIFVAPAEGLPKIVDGLQMN